MKKRAAKKTRKAIRPSSAPGARSALALNIAKIIVALAFLGTLWYGGTHDWFKFGTPASNGTSQPNITIINLVNNTGDNLTVENESEAYSVNLSVDPEEICLGEETEGTIESNILFGLCSIFFNPNGNGWEFYRSVQLDSAGGYSEEQEINAAGYAMFRVVCCDIQQNCKISNSARVDVEVCDEDEEQKDCSDICDGFEHSEDMDDVDDIAQGDDDENCKEYADSNCEDGFESAEAVDGCCCWTCSEAEEEEPECSDTDGGEDFLEKGTCTYGSFSSTDSCPVDLGEYINENYCTDGGCGGVAANCSIELGAFSFCHGGICILGSQDTDGDGVTDYWEYKAGSDPFDPDSKPV